jgi:hypothetical protein
MFYFVSTYFIIVQSYSQINAGLVLLSFTPGLGVSVIVTRIIINRTKQAKFMCLFGSILAPIGAGLLGMGIANNNTTELYVFNALVGFSCGTVIISSAIQLRFTHKSDEVATIVALNILFRTFGGTVGLAQMGAVLNAKSRSYITQAASSGQYSMADIQQAAAALSSEASIASLPANVGNLVKTAM